MKLFRRYGQLDPRSRGASVALGNFDGVHLGHRGVIERALKEAKNNCSAVGVVTFEPHPVSVLRPDIARRRLAPFRTKIRRLKECGVDLVYALPFSRQFSQITAESFVREVLVKGLGVCHVVVGHDYRFGKDRVGDYGLLAAQGKMLGFGVTEVAGIGESGQLFSSTRVRNSLESGNLGEASSILGSLWEVEERVRHGDARGRELGYPTANIAFKDHVVPTYGVYAVWCGVKEGGETKWYPAVANVGLRPMFKVSSPLLEAHLFGYDGNLYGKYLRVAFVKWIRPEKVFENNGLLVEQMDEDARIAKLILGESKSPEKFGEIDFAKGTYEG